MKKYDLFKDDNHRIFKIGSFFYLMRWDGGFWFRFFKGYGLWAKNIDKNMEWFSERSGSRKFIRIGRWKFEILKPDKNV